MNNSELSEKILNNIIDIQLDIDSIYSNEHRLSELRSTLIKDSFLYHYQINSLYRNYCDKINVSPFNNEFSIQKIPTLPSAFFKRAKLNIASVPQNTIIKNCTSSGTSGNISNVPRDENTLTTFLGSITSALPKLFELERTGNHIGFVLGPSTEESGDLWFSYVISCMSLLMQTETFEKDSEIDFKYLVAKLINTIKQNKAPFIIGPPFRIMELAKAIIEQDIDINLPEKSFIVSAGGWKNRQRESIDLNDFHSLIKTAFKLSGIKNIRDSYNMVELNSVINECECHSKHLPPWMYAIAWDPINGVFLDSKKEGVLCFFDASSFSYPCFIMSEDIGYINENNCDCGRKGQTIIIKRRINTIEARGCALKMAVGTDINNFEKGRFFQSFYRNH